MICANVQVDQAPAINAAMLPGKIDLPAGIVWIGSPVVLKTGCRLVGQGERVTILKRLPGYPGRLVETDGYGAVSGAGGPNRFGLHDLSLHGNAQDVPNATGRCLSIYGRAYSIQNVGIEYCAQEGFHSAWGQVNAAWEDDPTDSRMESAIDGLHIQFCRGTPVFDGPHDSQIDNVVVAMSRHMQPHIPGSATFLIGSGAAGSQFGKLHVWGDYAEWCVVNWASAITISNLVLDDARPGGGLLLQLGSDCLIAGRGLQYGADSIKGLQIGATGIPATGNRITLLLTQTPLCAVDFANDGGNDLDITVGGSATNFAGMRNPMTTLRYSERGNELIMEFGALSIKRQAVTFLPRSSPPTETWVPGQVYFDSTTKKLRCFDGAAIQNLY